MGTRDRRPGAPAWPDSSSARDEVHQSALYIDPNVDADRSDPADGCGITVIGTFLGNIRIYDKRANADDCTRLQDDGRCGRYQAGRCARPGADTFGKAGKRGCGIYT